MVIGKSQELSAMTIKVALQLPNCHILNHRIILHLSSKRGAQAERLSEMIAFFGFTT